MQPARALKVSSLPSVFIFKLYFPTASHVHPHPACLPLLGQAKSRPAPFPRAPPGHYDIWLVGFARKTDKHEDTIQRKNGTAGNRERRGWYKMTQQQNRFPETQGRHGRLLRPRTLRVNSRGSPSSRPPGRAGCRVTDALPGAGGKGRTRRILPPTAARGWGAAIPRLQVPALRHDLPASVPGGGGPASVTFHSRHHWQLGPAPLPACLPRCPTPGLTLTKAGGDRRLLLAAALLGLQQPG